MKKDKLFLLLILIISFGLSIIVQYYFYSGPSVAVTCVVGKKIELPSFNKELKAFLKRHYDSAYTYQENDLRGYFAIKEGVKADLYGSTDMVYILWITGQLEKRTTPEGKKEWARFINSFQNPETGYFDRGNVSGESATHATAFATAALVLLGSQPAHPHRWAENIFSRRESIEAWLDSFGWDQIWTGSHEAGAVSAILEAPKGITLPVSWKSWFFEALSRRIDEKTGFWKEGILDPVLTFPTTVDLGGAAHFWWLYHRMGKPVPFPEKVIEGILSLQRDSGIWGARIFNGAFPQGIDLDAINGLRLAWGKLPPEKQSIFRKKIIAALDRYGCAVELHLKAQGSVNRLFKTTHKLVGTLNALGELNLLYKQLTGEEKIAIPVGLRSSLTAASWQ